MTEQPLDAQAVAQAIIASSVTDLDAVLMKLDSDSEVIKQKARELAELTLAVSIAKAAKQDTTVAELALIASTKNLASVASLDVAEAVLGFTGNMLVQVGSAAVQIAIAAL